MITEDLIKQQELLKDLTPDQVKAIETLSKNDEETVIHKKRGDWYKQFDQDILDSSGIPKEPAERATDYAKRAFALQKAEIEELTAYKTKAKTLEAKIATLEDGKVDATTKQKIKDLGDELAALKVTHETAIREKETLLSQKDQELIRERQEVQFAAALSGVKFKSDETTTALKDIAVKSAKEALMAEYTMDIADGKTVWRDKKGEIVRNPKNGNEPMTTADLLMPKLAPVIDQGRKVNGTGTTKVDANGTSSTTFAPTAKTKTEFYTQASDYLIAQGNDRTNPEFAKKLTELSKEFNAQELPVT